MGSRGSSNHIKALQRRIDFLDGKDGSYNKAERSALIWALREITNEETNVYQLRAYINGQVTILKYYKDVLKKAAHSGNTEAINHLLKVTTEWLEEKK